MLPLRGAGAPVPEHGHRPSGRARDDAPGDKENDPGWIEALKATWPRPKVLVGGKEHKMAAISSAGDTP